MGRSRLVPWNVVWILIAALPIGMLIGLIGGGSLTTVRSVELRSWQLLIPAFLIVIYMALDRDPPLEWLLLPAALVLFATVAFRNIATVGMTIVGVGVLANLAPVLLNGEMPVRESAIIAADLADSSNIDQVLLGAGRRFEEPGDVLMPLAATVPVAAVREVLTLGDLVVVAGLINVGFRAVRPSSSRRKEDPVPPVSFTDAPVGDVAKEPETTQEPVLADILDLTTGHEGRAGEVPPHIEPSAAVADPDLDLDPDPDLELEIFVDDLPKVVQGTAAWGD